MKLPLSAALLSFLLLAPTTAWGEDAKPAEPAPAKAEEGAKELVKYETRPKELVGAWKVTAMTDNGKQEKIGNSTVIMTLLPDGSIQSWENGKSSTDNFLWGADKNHISIWKPVKPGREEFGDNLTGSWEIRENHLLTLNMVRPAGDKKKMTVTLEKTDLSKEAQPEAPAPQ